MRRSRPKPLVLVVAAIALLGTSVALPGRSVTAFAAAGTPPALAAASRPDLRPRPAGARWAAGPTGAAAAPTW